jgi:hypothetical protein
VIANRTLFFAQVPFIRRPGGEQWASPQTVARAESILGGTLRFFHEHRPVNRSHRGVRGGGGGDTSLLLASTFGYSQYRLRFAVMAAINDRERHRLTLIECAPHFWRHCGGRGQTMMPARGKPTDVVIGRRLLP